MNKINYINLYKLLSLFIYNAYTTNKCSIYSFILKILILTDIHFL